MQLTSVSGVSSLRVISSRISSSVAARIAEASLRSTLLAPLSANNRCIAAGFCQSGTRAGPKATMEHLFTRA